MSIQRLILIYLIYKIMQKIGKSEYIVKKLSLKLSQCEDNLIYTLPKPDFGSL